MTTVVGFPPSSHSLAAGVRQPIGRIEVATVQGRVYGIDSVGQVFRMEPAHPASQAPLRRVLTAIVARR